MYDVCSIRPHLKSAISWAIVAEVIRRHGDRQSLRVIQTHPGGGQYDCLSLIGLRKCDPGIYAKGNATNLGDFNRQSGSFRRWTGGSDISYPWLDKWLSSPDQAEVVDDICDLLGFASVAKVPTTSRQTFGIKLIATIVGARALQRDYLDVHMGYIDSSGMGGSGTDKSLRQFVALLREEGGEEKTLDSRAADCWLLYSGGERKLVGALRSDGFFSPATDCQHSFDLYPSYRAQRRMEPVLSEVLTLLSS